MVQLPKAESPIDLLRELLRARGTLGPPHNALDRLHMAIYLSVSKIWSNMHYESSIVKRWQPKMRICSGAINEVQYLNTTDT